MGEIATWSAVKTKVGLGKTGNDCPTKAELLALSSTGTGENYVGLELSNASSYGNNECVKLEDIHKVTYKYTFTSRYSSISFDALGNPSSSNQGFGFISTKQKYWDGIANGAEVTVNYIISNTPTWVNHGNQVPPWTASENLGLTSRSDSNTLVTQSESGKTFKVTFTQAAASQSWSYGFSVNPTSMSFGATGGTKTFTVTSYKQELRNGHNYGNQISLTYTRANGGSISGTGTSVTMGNNTSTSTRSGTVTLTQAETNKKVTISCSQSAGYKTYSEITASGGAVTDIPASGGTRSSFTTLPTYSQTWGWNGSTTGGGTITSGASISYGTAVKASNLEDTVKSRTQVGTLTGTLSLNGKTKSVSIPVYQGANQWEGYSYGSSWSVTLTASSYTISNTGGSVTLYPSASRDRYSNYTSGYTVSDGYDTADPSLGTNGISGFTLSGTTLTASSNSSTNSRTVRVFANYEGASDYVDITQGGASVSYNYYFYWKGMATSESVYHAAAGDTLSRYFSSYKKKVINGSETSDTYEVGVSLSGVPPWASVSVSSNTVTSKASENVEESSRSAAVTVTQNESGEEITLYINQSAATITYEYVFELS